MRGNLRLFGHQGGIHVHNPSRPKRHLPGGFLQKYFAPHRVPAGVGIREEMPDIGLPDGSQNRIANGVHQDIRIGMAVQALRVRYLDTAEEELATLDQPMDVIAYTDMVHGG